MPIPTSGSSASYSISAFNFLYRLNSRRTYLEGLLGVVLACCMVGCSRSTSQIPDRSDAQLPVFTPVTKEAGLADFKHVNGAAGRKWYPEQMGSGGGFIDYDGDGWLDILLLGGGIWSPDTLDHPRAVWIYRNNRDGTFSDVTREAGLHGVRAYTIGFAAADYDNDGDEDLFITNLGENMLFENTGGRFEEVTQKAGIQGNDLWSSSAIFFDADLDGYVDLYVANYVDWSPETDIFCPQGGTVKLYCHPAVYTGVQSRFYRNNGDGTFTDRTEEAGFMPTLGKSLGVSELDFNFDGWPDLAVVNDGEGDLLFRNNGDGTFTDIGFRSGFAFSEHGEARAGMGVDAGVVDSTGRYTLFVGNFSEEMVGVYRNVGGESFVDQSALSRIGFPSLLSLTFGLFLFDVDLDSDLDLLIANGHVHPDRTGENDRIRYRQPAQLFLNRGDGKFDEVREAGGVLSLPLVARGAAYGDYDKDGDLDVLITENNGPVHLWRNDTNGGNYLRVHVRGRESNRDGLGTRLTALLNGLTMERRIRTGSSYLSQSEKVATFGLGSANEVDSLVVYWPSGLVERFATVEGNQDVLLIEGTGELRSANTRDGGTAPL
ncbi:MAG TPA: CRTAC1 family protein [Rhodothermales bacterium]|nr:CRTAC1 family protein [Rhodothermales bacterium]